MTGTLWITGAAGWSGGHLIRMFAGRPDRPRLVGLDTAAEPAGLDAFGRIDLCEPDEVAGLCARELPTWVIHLAAATPPAPQERMWQVNVGGTLGLLLGLARGGARSVRVVSVGSAGEYEPSAGEILTESHPCGGSTPYGRSKFAQTLTALEAGRTLGIPVVVARAFNLIGPGMPETLVAGALCAQFARARDGEEILVGNTKSARDFIDIRDAVAAYWALARQGRPGEVYNVCTGTATTVEQLLELFRQAAGVRVSWRTDPARLRAVDVAVSCGSPARIRAATGWQAGIDPAATVRDMVVAVRRTDAEAE